MRTGQSVFGHPEGEPPKPIVQTKQVVDLTDRTIGVTSYPAYYDYLAAKSVEALMKELERAFSTP
jgi:hypothetical protein